MGLLAGTVLLPAALMAIGVWEVSRGEADLAEAVRLHDRLLPIVARLEARQARSAPGAFDSGLEFRQGGQLYGGPYAVTKAQEALAGMTTAVRVAGLRTWLPPIVALGAGAAAALSVLALLAAVLLGRAGRASRDSLLRGFSVVRRALPVLMGTQVVLMAVAFVAAVAFEAVALLEVDAFSVGGIKLLALGAAVAGISLFTAGNAVLQLRRAVAAFQPDPLPIDGRLVLPAEMPGLEAMLADLARRLDALRPDNVVVGLTGGFYVSSGPKWLRPVGAMLTGRTLYVPLPALTLLRADEVAAIIGHELAHFAGGDTEWSQRFLPIYAGVGRSLGAVSTAGAGGRGAISPLMVPSLRLGQFVMDQFHHAVRHWSRLREFAADAAGAAATSPDAAARALLRTSAMQPRIEEVLAGVAREPGKAPADMVGAILEHARMHGLDDPHPYLEDEQPHPTDTHPSTRQRLAALGQSPTATLLAEAAASPSPDGLMHLDAWFADPAALCRGVTADALAALQQRRRAYREDLQATADLAADATTLLEDTRLLVIVIVAVAFLLAGVGVIGVMGPSLRMPSLDAQVVGIVVGLTLLIAAIVVAIVVRLMRRGRVPFMVLRPEAMELPGLDRPIPWEHIADLDVTLTRGGIVTRLLLPPDAAFPALLPSARRLRLDPVQHIVTLKAYAPRRMTARAYAALIGRYRQAAHARRVLRNVGPEV